MCSLVIWNSCCTVLSQNCRTGYIYGPMCWWSSLHGVGMCGMTWHNNRLEASTQESEPLWGPCGSHRTSDLISVLPEPLTFWVWSPTPGDASATFGILNSLLTSSRFSVSHFHSLPHLFSWDTFTQPCLTMKWDETRGHPVFVSPEASLCSGHPLPVPGHILALSSYPHPGSRNPTGLSVFCWPLTFNPFHSRGHIAAGLLFRAPAELAWPATLSV